jgi:hypothetical protein
MIFAIKLKDFDVWLGKKNVSVGCMKSALDEAFKAGMELGITLQK